MIAYIVQLDTDHAGNPFFLAVWSGDPGRTYTRSYARRYKTEPGARLGLGHARRWRTFPNAKILEVSDGRPLQ